MQNFWKEGMFEDMDVRYFRLIDRSPDILELLSNDMKNQFNNNDSNAEDSSSVPSYVHTVSKHNFYIAKHNRNIDDDDPDGL